MTGVANAAFPRHAQKLARPLVEGIALGGDAQGVQLGAARSTPSERGGPT
jgi:hypothetical protein